MSRLNGNDREIIRLVRQLQTSGSPFTVPKDVARMAGVPERMPDAPRVGRHTDPAPATEQEDSVTCEECGTVVGWSSAFFLPFATLCEAGGACEAHARRKEAARDA